MQEQEHHRDWYHTPSLGRNSPITLPAVCGSFSEHIHEHHMKQVCFCVPCLRFVRCVKRLTLMCVQLLGLVVLTGFSAFRLFSTNPCRSELVSHMISIADDTVETSAADSLWLQ